MSANDPLERRIQARIRALGESHLLRTLRAPQGIDLSSNDYLSLSQHSALKTRMIEAVERDGCGSTGSRLLCGERDSFAAVERSFAAFKSTGRSLYFSSGYLANLAVITTFAEAGDVLFSDALNHASLIDAVRLSSARRVVFPHADVAHVERLMKEHRGGQAFLVTESLFGMDGDIAPLDAYAAVCRATGTALIVDEAHAVGVYGARGSGLIEECGVGADVLLSVNTAGKALGVSGAFVAGRSWAIEYLVQRARPFIFSTAPPPSVAEALQASLSIVLAEPERRQRLMHLARHLRDELRVRGIAVPEGTSHIVPVIVGANDRASDVASALQAGGFDVRAIRPPSVPHGSARLRIAVNVGLDEATIERFADALAAAMKESSRWAAVSS